MSPSTNQWATFFLGEEQFAVRVEDVQEVLVAQPVTPVPLAPAQIVGLINLRGAIIPAIDLRTRLGLEKAPDAVVSKLLVVKLPDGLFSVVVDEIGDVFELKEETWRSVPETLSERHRAFVFGIVPLKQQLLLGVKVDALAGAAA